MKDKFKELQSKDLQAPSIVIFGRLVKGRKMGRAEIRKWFGKLVDKEDWEGSSKNEVLEFYYKYSNNLEK